MRSVLTAVGLAATIVAAPGIANAQEVIADPWEQTNRDLFAVHETVDRSVLEPVARGYRAVTPQPLRRGVVNFLRNLRAPVTFANDLLQGQGGRAGVTAARFGVNTLVGFGLFDPASSLGLEYHEEDFGQTLAVWGVDAGPYVFVPLLGPTSVRDAAGRIVDAGLDPLSWTRFEGDDTARASRTVLTALAAREAVIEAVDDVRANSLDPYVSIRTTYALLRESAVQNGDAGPAPDDGLEAAPENSPQPQLEAPQPETTEPAPPSKGANS